MVTTDKDQQNANPVDELEDIIMNILETEGSYSPDLLYPSVRLALGRDDELVMRKIFDNDRNARRMAAAFDKGHRRDPPLTPRATRVNEYTVDVGYVRGIEVHKFNRDCLRRKAKLSRPEDIEEFGLIDRMMFATTYALMSFIARYQHNPLTRRPTQRKKAAKTLRKKYSKNLLRYFGESVSKEESSNISKAIAVLMGNLPSLKHPRDHRHITRYLDAYVRNIKIEFDEFAVPLDKLVSKYRNKTTTEMFNSIANRLRQLDLDRANRDAYDLEDVVHVLSDPGLDLCIDEQHRYARVFSAFRAYHAEREAGNSRTIEKLRRKLVATSDFENPAENERLMGSYSISDTYFLAMVAYRNLRKASLIEGVYLQKYRLRMDKAKERLLRTLNDDVKEQKKPDIDRFEQKGVTSALNFVTNKISAGRLVDEELQLTGLRYDPRRLNPNSYRMFKGDDDNEKQVNARNFLVAFSQYVHSRQRHNDCVADRETHLERAYEAVRALQVMAMRKLSGRYSTQLGEYAVAIGNTGASFEPIGSAERFSRHAMHTVYQTFRDSDVKGPTGSVVEQVMALELLALTIEGKKEEVYKKI